jgi:addiction module HigA family antidote
MLTNASYFAFTATPKSKTLEMFGEPLPPDPEGKVKHRPFHGYTMKQAVEEGFILDVLKSYTPVDSYYKLVKKTEDDPGFDTKKAKKKLRRYVESHDHAIRLKAEIMVDHFHEQVIAAGQIGGQARAMVVTSGIERAIQYFHAFKAPSRGAQEPVPTVDMTTLYRVRRLYEQDDPKGLPVDAVDKLRKMLAFLQAVASANEVRDVPVWKARLPVTMTMLTPPHPGAFVRTEILVPLGLSVAAAAKILGVSRPTLSTLLNGHSDLSGEMALRLEKAFGVKMDTLMRMQSACDLARARRQASAIKVKRYEAATLSP